MAEEHIAQRTANDVGLPAVHTIRSELPQVPHFNRRTSSALPVWAVLSTCSQAALFSGDADMFAWLSRTKNITGAAPVTFEM